MSVASGFNMETLDSILNKWEMKERYLIEILYDIQEEFAYLPRAALEKVALSLNLPLNKLYHIASVYKAFKLQPGDNYRTGVYSPSVYHVKGSDKILDTFSRKPDTKQGETQEKGKFQIESHESLKEQKLVVTKNCYDINPDSIDDYIAHDGYKALARAVTSMTPETVLREIKDSGLRGRGGGGFPTAIKWEACRNAGNGERYLVCTTEDGRSVASIGLALIESNPHGVIEGMIIGAFAIGAQKGFICLPDYDKALPGRIKKAIEQAREKGYLGTGILGHPFNFDIELRRSNGALMLNHPSALVSFLEGGAPEPRSEYSNVIEKGLFDKPTNINCTETWANVPGIILHGSKWFKSTASKNGFDYSADLSSGTKVFSLAGAVLNSGIIEVPMGVTLRDIIYDIGGGITDGKAFKAVQLGGIYGYVIPENLLYLPVDFDRFIEKGVALGSGSLLVIDEDVCMVDYARYCIDALKNESCGKCTPCREGLFQMARILHRICDGKGEQKDIDTLLRLSSTMRDASLCGFGVAAPIPFLSTFRYFKEEYESHLNDKECPAHVCRMRAG